MNDYEDQFHENEVSKSISPIPRSPYLPLIETEDRILQKPDPFYQNPQIKRLVLFALELKLNLTTVSTILRTLDMNQPEENVRNQMLDLYYQETPMPPGDMVSPGVLLRTFSQKITTVSPSASNRRGSEIKEKPVASHSYVIEIEPKMPREKLAAVGGVENCPICYEETMLEKLECGHGFCKGCLMDYLRNKINVAQIEKFKCPMDKCEYQIQDATLISLLDREPGLTQKYQKFLMQREVQQDKSRRFCIRPGCETIIKKDFDSEHGKCEKCGQEVCFLCGNVWHPLEKNCLLAMDNVFQDYLQNVDFKNCPKCHQIIEKTVGCNVMACPYCRFQFCWLCLREYKIGHFSIFNLNGCPGMDSVSISRNASSCRRLCEKATGFCGFFLKMLWFFVIGVLIYPFLIFICVFIVLKEHKKSGGVVKCDRVNRKKVCCLVCLGVMMGLFGYVAYPIGFLGIFCYMCICNPHVAYPYQNNAGGGVQPPANAGIQPPANAADAQPVPDNTSQRLAAEGERNNGNV